MTNAPSDRATSTAPPELVITLAAASAASATRSARYSTGWVYADEIRAALRLLGHDATSQQVAAWLRRMSRVDAPWIELRGESASMVQYRVTRYGRTDVDNRLAGVSIRTPWLDARVAA